MMFDFYVSGYAQAEQAGIGHYSLDPQTGRIIAGELFNGLTNPSFLLCHPNKTVLYAVQEVTPEGKLTALSIENGRLRQINSLSTGGANPCHIALSGDGRHLFVANYTDGSISVFELDEQGIPIKMTDYHKHHMVSTAKGMNPMRQEAPHAHFSMCAGSRVFVNDLGLNIVILYDWDPQFGKLIETGNVLELRAGAGPRHLAMSSDGKYVYVFSELNGCIYVFVQKHCGNWLLVQTVSSVPENYNGFSDHGYAVGAAIRLENNRLYTSNRGHNSISVFPVNSDGTLGCRHTFPSGGKTPRDFQVIGKRLIIANQDSNSVVIMKHTAYNESASPESSFEFIHPSCICVVPQ